MASWRATLSLLFIPAVVNFLIYLLLNYLIAPILAKSGPLFSLGVILGFHEWWLRFISIFLSYFLAYSQVNFLIPVYVPLLHIIFLYLTLRVASKDKLSLKDLIAYKPENLKVDVLIAILLTVIMTPTLYFLFKVLYGTYGFFINMFFYMTPPWYTAALVIVAFTAGISEEVIWRGYGITAVESLTKTHSSLKAIILTSVAFAVWHVRLPHLPATFLFGLVYAYVYTKRRSLVPLIASHTAIDLIFAFVPY